MNNGKLVISEDYLQELIDYCSRSLCGKIMKRFEIIDNKSVLKSNVKEMVYEEYRNLRDLILAYGKGGLEMSSFVFKSGKDTSST